MFKRLLVLFIWLLSLPGFLGASLIPPDMRCDMEALGKLVKGPANADDLDEDAMSGTSLVEEEKSEGVHYHTYKLPSGNLYKSLIAYFLIIHEDIPPHHVMCVDEQPPNIFGCA